MPDSKIPKAIASKEFKIFGVTVKCHVLEDGRRIVEEQSVADMLNAMSTPDRPNMDEIESFHRWMREQGKKNE